jgi:hypothetical protein
MQIDDRQLLIQFIPYDEGQEYLELLCGNFVEVAVRRKISNPNVASHLWSFSTTRISKLFLIPKIIFILPLPQRNQGLKVTCVYQFHHPGRAQ